MIFQTYNCNPEFLESKRREPKILDFDNQNFHTLFKHLKTRCYVELFQNSILASVIAVFERDLICLSAKVISEASGPMQVNTI